MSTQPKHTAALRRTVAVVAIALTVALTVLPGAQTPASADTHALQPPSDITVTPMDRGAIFEWEPVPSATAYEIRQWDQQGNWRTLPYDSFTVAYSGPSATIGGLVNGYEYYYRMRSISDQQTSAWTTTWLEVELHDFPQEPILPPSDLKAATPATGAVALTWTPRPQALRHWIAAYHSDTIVVWTQADDSNSHKAVGLASSGPHHFAITAEYRVGEDLHWSPWSSYIRVVPD